jgi:hypothetical protein
LNVSTSVASVDVACVAFDDGAGEGGVTGAVGVATLAVGDVLAGEVGVVTDAGAGETGVVAVADVVDEAVLDAGVAAVDEAAAAGAGESAPAGVVPPLDATGFGSAVDEPDAGRCDSGAFASPDGERDDASRGC